MPPLGTHRFQRADLVIGTYRCQRAVLAISTHRGQRAILIEDAFLLPGEWVFGQARTLEAMRTQS